MNIDSMTFAVWRLLLHCNAMLYVSQTLASMHTQVTQPPCHLTHACLACMCCPLCQYPLNYYPPFASGCGFVLSRDLVRALLKQPLPDYRLLVSRLARRHSNLLVFWAAKQHPAAAALMDVCIPAHACRTLRLASTCAAATFACFLTGL